MAHLASRAGFGLAVDVQFGMGIAQDVQPLVDVVADQILHLGVGVAFGRSQRQAAETWPSRIAARIRWCDSGDSPRSGGGAGYLSSILTATSASAMQKPGLRWETGLLTAHHALGALPAAGAGTGGAGAGGAGTGPPSAGVAGGAFPASGAGAPAGTGTAGGAASGAGAAG